MKELLSIRELSHSKLFKIFSLEKDQTRVGEITIKISSIFDDRTCVKRETRKIIVRL